MSAMSTRRVLRSNAGEMARSLSTQENQIEEVKKTKRTRKSDAEKPASTKQKKTKRSEIEKPIAAEPIPGDRVLHLFPKLQQGNLIQRYKRFLADIKIEGQEDPVTVHCPNTGPMVGLLDLPLAPVQLSVSDNVNRKYIHTLEMVQVEEKHGRTWVGVHSASANRMVETALRSGWMPEVVENRRIKHIQAEVKHSKDSRIDFVVETTSKDEDEDQVDAGKTFYIEVKSVTLAQQKDDHLCAVFPDTVSTRASKHVEELIHIQKTKSPAIQTAIIFLVQRGDCNSFKPSHEHDQKFAELCEEAEKKGVELHAYSCSLEPEAARVVLKEYLSKAK